MKLGVHKDDLAPSLAEADEVFLFQPGNIPWSVKEIADQCAQQAFTSDDIDSLVTAVVAEARPDDAILVMSNGGFGGIHGKLLDALKEKECA